MPKNSDKAGLTITLADGLKAELVADAVKQNRSLSDTVLAILSEHFGVTAPPTGVIGHSLGLTEEVCVDVPFALREKIGDELRGENRRRRQAEQPKLNRSDFLAPIFRDYLDARRSVAA